MNSNRTGLKVFLATAIGTGLGGLIARELAPYLWWVGALAGGVIGYLAYEPMEVIRAVPRALRTAFWATWNNGGYWLKMFIKGLPNILLTILLLTTILSCMMVPIHYLSIYTQPERDNRLLDSTSIPILLSIIVFYSIFGGVVLEKKGNEEKQETRRMMLSILARVNPISLCYYIVKYALKLILILLKFVFWQLWCFLFTFGWSIYKQVHSDVRLLCGIDALLFAGLCGIFTDLNLIFGALAGGLFGLLNYEVMSKRVLHLVPARNR